MPDWLTKKEIALRDFVPLMKSLRGLLETHKLIVVEGEDERLIAADLRMIFGLIDHAEGLAEHALARIEAGYRERTAADCGGDVSAFDATLDKTVATLADQLDADDLADREATVLAGVWEPSGTLEVLAHGERDC